MDRSLQLMQAKRCAALRSRRSIRRLAACTMDMQLIRSEGSYSISMDGWDTCTDVKCSWNLLKVTCHVVSPGDAVVILLLPNAAGAPKLLGPGIP